MNRHEVEARLRVVEAKLKFVMHTLALTQTNNTTGKQQSKSFDILFEQAVVNGNAPGLDQTVAGTADTRTGSAPPTDDLASAGDIPINAPGPDGVP